MKYLYIIILLIFGNQIVSGQLFPFETKRLMDPIFNYYTPKDSVNIIIKDKNKKIWTVIKTTPKEVFKKTHEFNRKLIEEGRIYNQIKLIKITKKQNRFNYLFLLSDEDIQKIDSLFFISSSKNIPSNLKKFLNRKYKEKELNLHNTEELTAMIKSRLPRLKVLSIRPVIYKTQTGISIHYSTHYRNFFEGQLNTIFQNNHTVLQGFLNLEVENIFKQGEDLQFYWKKEKSFQEFNIAGSFPYLFSSAFYGKGKLQFIENSTKDPLIQLKIETGWQSSRFDLGLIYHYLKNEDQKFYRQAGGKISYRFPVNSRVNFYLQKNLSMEITQSVQQEKNTFVDFKASYPFLLYKNYYFYPSFSLIKNTNSSYLQPLNIETNQYTPFRLADKNFNRFAVFNIKLLASYPQSSFYLTSSILNGKQLDTYKEYQIGIGILNIGKNQLLNVEFIYSSSSYLNIINKGFMLKIKQKISI